MTELSGASILVVGATGGLGSAIARQLATAGAKLTLAGRDEYDLAVLGLDAVTVTGDVRDVNVAQQFVAAAVGAHDRLDGLVVATGVVAFGPADSLDDDTLVQLFAINTLAPIRLMREAAPHLAASAASGGSPFVVNLPGVVADSPTAGMAAYSASKAALAAFDQAAGREFKRQGIRVIDARPGHTETELSQHPLAGEAPRMGQGHDPHDVAARIVRAIVDGERDLPASAFE